MATIKSAFIFIIGMLMALFCGALAHLATVTDNFFVAAACAFMLMTTIFMFWAQFICKGYTDGDN